MPAISKIEEMEQETMVDDISNLDVKKEDVVDQSVLAALRAKSQAKQQEAKVAAKIVSKKERSLNFGIIGSGQAGSRLAEAFYQLGYDAVVCNTALQDLKYINIPDSNKLLLEFGVGGASKELEIGKQAASLHKGEIAQLINNKLNTSQVNILCLSLGGGSGAGSCETLVDILSETGKPLVVMTILPMFSDDAQTKSNALETLAKLASFARSKKISNLLVVDNAKLESIYQNSSQLDFFALANKATVNTLDVFNTLSAAPSAVKSLDSMEFSKLLIDSEGLSIFGELTVDNYTDDTAIAESIINNLNHNLLADGFDLKQSRYVGFIIAANKEVWSKIPASSVNYASAMINDFCATPKGVFKGIYTTDSQEDTVKVYSFFNGLGLPSERVEELKKETVELQAKAKNKDENRNLSLHLDSGSNETVSQAQAVKNKIAAKNSTFGKFVANSITDRRK